jgi:SAM-dependent methyltransferase
MIAAFDPVSLERNAREVAMGIGYELAYRLGVRPWERAAAGGQEQLDRLLDREQPPRGTALDLGCGRGLHTVELARRGWAATGVDAVARAVEDAERLARRAQLPARFVRADVCALPDEVGTGYAFVLDVGCFHGLDDDHRARYGREVTRVAGPDATMLMLAFAPGRHGPLPRGAGTDDVRRALPGWRLVEQEPAVTDGMPGPMRRLAPVFYRLARG